MHAGRKETCEQNRGSDSESKQSQGPRPRFEMGGLGILRFVLVSVLTLCVTSAFRPNELPPVNVQCYDNPVILRRPLKITNATLISNTAVSVRVRSRRKTDSYNKIFCGSLYPELIPCPFDGSPKNASISWQFCPEGKSTNHCVDRPARSFYTFLFISGLKDGDQGTYSCMARTPNRIIYERWEVRRLYFHWDLIWTNNSLNGFYVQLGHTGELLTFGEEAIGLKQARGLVEPALRLRR